MAVATRIYPLDGLKDVGPLIKRGSFCSVQVEVISGTGAAGTYQLQSSNSGQVYITEGSAITNAGITEATVNKQYVKVTTVGGVGAGTAVRVSLYADEPGE